MQYKIDEHFIVKVSSTRNFWSNYVPSEDQLAGSLTIPLHTSRFLLFQTKLIVLSKHIRLRRILNSVNRVFVSLIKVVLLLFFVCSVLPFSSRLYMPHDFDVLEFGYIKCTRPQFYH